MQDDIPVRATKDTIIHEMLHTCPGCFNHGKEWQALANKVNTAYGYNVKCASSCKDKGVSENVMQSTRREETIHYVLRCERCNAHWEYSRHSKIVQCRTGQCKVWLRLQEHFRNSHLRGGAMPPLFSEPSNKFSKTNCPFRISVFEFSF